MAKIIPGPITNLTQIPTRNHNDTQNRDAAELWIHNDGVGTTSVQNLRIAYDDSPIVAVDSVNS